MIEVEANISIKRDGTVFLNPAKTALLYEIKRSGSLNAAAKTLNISYQHAWNLINEMNRTAPEPMVIKQRGGANGGGAEISQYGQRILNEYQMIGAAIQKTINQINVEINL
ncbi:MAG: winged helix-turn-helix domain-containing protein [Prolixibacteraceae bacterium]